MAVFNISLKSMNYKLYCVSLQQKLSLTLGHGPGAKFTKHHKTILKLS